MKSALRFLQHMPGFVPMNIKNCLLRLLFLFGWCGFSWEEDKERNGRIILQRQPLQGQNPFFIEFIACCRAYNVIMFSNKGSLCSISSAYPCRRICHSLQKWLWARLQCKPCERKKISRAFERMTSTWKTPSSSLSKTQFFFLKMKSKNTGKHQEKRLLSATPEAMGHTAYPLHLITSTSLECLPCL